MFSNKIKRCLLLIMALAAMLSLLTFQIFAAESDTQAEIDRILNDYLGTTTMSPEDISAAVAEMDWETYQTARWEISELENSLVASMERGELTEAEAQQLIDRNTVLCNFSDALEEKNASDNEVSLFTTVNVLDSQVSVTDTADSNTVSNGTVTIKASGSLLSKKTNTVTITNETTDTATLAFDYTASTYNSFTIAGASAAASGTYSILLEPGASVTLVLVSNSGLSNRTATLTLSNFSLTVAQTSSEVTFEYDSTYGSVTVDGLAVDPGETKEIALTGAALVATTKNSGRFLGWINAADGKILSTDTSYTHKTATDMIIKPVFVGKTSKPYFWLGTVAQKSESIGFLGLSKRYYYEVACEYLYDNLNNAAIAARDGNLKYIVLANDGTLTAGDYKIFSGVTLLIPFDSVYTLYTTEAVDADGSYSTPKAFRTLTLADGANLTIEGNLSLSAKHRYTNGGNSNGASPTGNVSFIKMEGESSITVNSGGNLYAWGYITGEGSVSIESGASVYENFQIMDFRGGSQSSDMDKGVFPLSQYYIQNVEVPMTLKAGAKEYGYATVYAQSTTVGSAINFIGSSDSMFNLTSGSITKRYDGSLDRLVVDLNGNIEIAAIALDLGLASVESTEYELPINGNFTINIISGNVVVAQDIAMLPGTQFSISEEASITLGKYNVYIYDSDEWGGYCGAGNMTFIPLSYAPGRSYTRTDADMEDVAVLVNGTIDASAGYVYTTAGGANIYSTGAGKVTINPGSETVTYQVIQASDVTNSTYPEIPITSAKLKNSDGTYVETTEAGEYSYKTEHGRWDINNHALTHHVAVQATCTTDGNSAYYECSCGKYFSDEAGTIEINENSWIIAAGHTEAIDAAVPATCTTAGKTEGKHCSVCNKVLVAQEVVAALGHTEVIDEAVAATCTETGLTEGKHCSVCNEVIIAQEVVAALSHVEGEAVRENEVEATFDAAGSYDSVIYCGTCGEELSRQTHTIAQKIAAAKIGETRYETLAEAISAAKENGTVVLLAESTESVTVSKPLVILKNGFTAVITAEGYTITESAEAYVIGRTDLFDFQAANVNMGNDLDMMFAFSNTALESWDGHYVEIVRSYANGNADTVITVPFDQWQTNGSYYVVTYEGLAAKEMCDILTLTVYDASGNAVSNPWVDSMRSYAMRILALSSVDTQKTLAVDFLNYGAAAQEHFKYDADNLANGLLTDDQKELASEAKAYTDELSHGEKFAGSSLVLESNLRFNMAINGLTADMTATVSFVDHYGTEVNEDAVIGLEGGKLCVQTNALVVADARQVITITVKNADGTAYATCQESIEAYLARYAQTEQSPSALDAAVMKFADSAYAYLHRNDK